jgi:5-methylcytosine-specific restriction endonuclease McrBC regulatory subunit McrC
LSELELIDISPQNLKSPEELEEEDRAAKSAVSSHPTLLSDSLLTYHLMQKLQELIRRGTPRDLAQAQELMKELSGAVRRRSSRFRYA